MLDRMQIYDIMIVHYRKFNEIFIDNFGIVIEMMLFHFIIDLFLLIDIWKVKLEELVPTLLHLTVLFLHFLRDSSNNHEHLISLL